MRMPHCFDKVSPRPAGVLHPASILKKSNHVFYDMSDVVKNAHHCSIKLELAYANVLISQSISPKLKCVSFSMLEDKE